MSFFHYFRKSNIFHFCEHRWLERFKPFGAFEKVRIVLQIPRVFKKLRLAGKVGSVAEMYDNIFGPIVDAILIPTKENEPLRNLYK
jgi:hypothetical protein